MTVNRERVKLFVDALPNYRQETGALCRIDQSTGERKYCCLGVATVIAIQNGVEGLTEVDDGYTVEWDTEEGRVAGNLPNVVMEWYGFERNDPLLSLPEGVAPVPWCGEPDCESCSKSRDTVRAIVANDSMHLTFTEIAAGFAKMYLSEEGTES